MRKAPSRIRRPLQARSQATLDRLEAAAAALLERRSWHEVSVAALCRRARTPVGSFYARFADKDALLDYLDDRYSRQVQGLIAEMAETPGATLGATIRHMVERAVAFHIERRGLIRALVLRARSRREPAWELRTQAMNALLPRLIGRLLVHRSEIRHADPARAAATGLTLVLAAMRDRILFPESLPGPEAADRATLVSALSHLFASYLMRPRREVSP
jgi:AcrR family transcriptional regulator